MRNESESLGGVLVTLEWALFTLCSTGTYGSVVADEHTGERGMFSEAAFVSISHFLTATATSGVRFSYVSPLLRVNWEISESFPCSLYRLTRGRGGYAELLTTHNRNGAVCPRLLSS